MAELATLARPYAEAVFMLAKESGNFDRWSDMLGFLSQIIRRPEISSLFQNPRVHKETLVKLLLDIGAEQLDEAGQNLLKLLAANRKLTVISQIAQQYETLKAKHEGYIKVNLVSTYAVSKQQRQDLETLLQKRFGKRIEIDATIDRSLLGGWLIRAGDQVIDLSVRGRLQKLAGQLRN
jgi:F-type H+-transporting ATPase subunit delta